MVTLFSAWAKQLLSRRLWARALALPQGTVALALAALAVPFVARRWQHLMSPQMLEPNGYGC